MTGEAEIPEALADAIRSMRHCLSVLADSLSAPAWEPAECHLARARERLFRGAQTRYG